jgi:enoyl-[acyl-carrier protein] reductase II
VTGYKEALVRTAEDGTVVSRAFTGKTLRAVANKWTEYFEQNPEELQPFPMQAVRSMQEGVMNLGGDESAEVDPERECYPAGQGVGAIHELVPAGELVRRFVTEAEEALERASATRTAPVS